VKGVKIGCKGWNVKVQEKARESESGSKEERKKISLLSLLSENIENGVELA